MAKDYQLEESDLKKILRIGKKEQEKGVTKWTK